MTLAKGILPRQRNTNPDRVIRNPHASGYFITVELTDPLGRDQVIEWLRDEVKPLVERLVEPARGREVEQGHDTDARLGSVAIGFGERFFARAFDPTIAPPLDFKDRPRRLPGATHPDDIMFYVMTLSEARAADFIAGLWATRPILANLRLLRGYQRIDDTEVFGYRDGIRNPHETAERQRVAFVDSNRDSGEPSWAHGGTYMAYMRIQQNEDSFRALADDAARDAIIGRTREGKRLDQDAADFKAEPADYGSAMPPTSHVRKAGPRGKHEEVKIFRRGLPYVSADDSGQVTRGLNFASFQRSLDPLDVILNDWMQDTRFPEQQTEIGPDALLAHIQTVKQGLYFVPPHDEEYPGATMFREVQTNKAKTGKIHIRKTVIDASGSNRGFERSGFAFDLVNTTDGSIVATATTDHVGHATFDDVHLNTAYEVREQPPTVPGVQGAAAQAVTLDSGAVVLRFANTQNNPAGPYG